ncbi:amidohydrolase family protein [Jiella avicenniae]|uniref:Amidohydrolase family protein n=1 Tax=Jiella avicenniae TaxID=2907202 RepID=A0A9X1TD32_9HYPH|nr:amidohydrolase family protein [Jiella avicenniae]MCE7029623.1 amidohydrolase family protein [Jiella avicenniae]
MREEAGKTDRTDRLPPWRRRPAAATPNPLPRPDWLAEVVEPALEPNLPIVDAHHHLWDRQGFRYLLEEFAEDIGESGHNVLASVFVQCRAMLRADGPEDLRPVGEVEFVRGLAAQANSGFYGPNRIAAIVGGADLTLGGDVARVLDAMSVAGGRLFRGVRTPVAAHPDPVVRSNPVPAPEGLIVTEAFQAGARALARRGLTLDLWVYQTQLGEVAQIARAIPDLTIVLDHAGGPLGVGPYASRSAEDRKAWRDGLAAVATAPNAFVKIGGFAMPVMGFGFHERARPPSSVEFAEAVAPEVSTCLDLFGPERAMFESNFPVDKGGYSYGIYWNAMKRLTADLDAPKRARLFAGTACEAYGFTLDI